MNEQFSPPVWNFFAYLQKMVFLKFRNYFGRVTTSQEDKSQVGNM